MPRNNHSKDVLLRQEPETAPPRTARAIHAAQHLLRSSGFACLQLVSCDFHKGVLTLRGQVPTYYLKQLAQSLVRDADGVAEVNNCLEVAVYRH